MCVSLLLYFIRFWIFCLDSLAILLPSTIKLFGFPIFWYWGTWWSLFHKPAVLIKFDIYVFTPFIFYIWLTCFFLLCKLPKETKNGINNNWHSWNLDGKGHVSTNSPSNACKITMAILDQCAWWMQKKKKEEKIAYCRWRHSQQTECLNNIILSLHIVVIHLLKVLFIQSNATCYMV